MSLLIHLFDRTNVQLIEDGERIVMNTSSRNGYYGVARIERLSKQYAHYSRSIVVKRNSKNKTMRILVLLMSVVTLCALFMPRTAVSAVPEKFVTYTVRPGDNLWNYAATITPKNGNVADNVERLISFNHLSSPDLEVGQSINVPIVSSNK